MATDQSFIFNLLVFALFLSQPLYGQSRLKKIGGLSSELEEISGFVKGKDNTYLAINDSGNSNEVFVLNEKGDIIKKVKVVNAKNRDWEAITKDQNGFVYIGDIGNNANKRQGLTIYKILESDLYNNSEVQASTISISYKDQTEFPPAIAQRNYDAEALLVRFDRIYIFTKNRTNPFSGYTYLYKIPNKAGEHTVSRIDSFYTGDVIAESWVTDAAYSDDMRHLVLLGQDRLWLISDFQRDSFFRGYVQTIEFNHFSQKESVSFKNDSILIIADESGMLTNGQLYEININSEIRHLDSLRKKEVTLRSKEFEDTLYVSINTVVPADVFFEVFDQNMQRVDYGRIDFFPAGRHSFSIVPKNVMNGGLMLNIKVGNRPHGFFVNRFKEVNWDELYRIRDSIQNNR